MDEQAKKTALRMMPYGLYVLGSKGGDELSVATVNWVTQASFAPPLLAMGIKADSTSFKHLRPGSEFALSILGTGQKDIAFAFFEPVEQDGQTINGYAYETQESGAPILVDAPAWVEGGVTDVVERGDHAVIVAEVTNAGVRRESGILTLAECGVNYGG